MNAKVGADWMLALALADVMPIDAKPITRPIYSSTDDSTEGEWIDENLARLTSWYALCGGGEEDADFRDFCRVQFELQCDADIERAEIEREYYDPLRDEPSDEVHDDE